MCVVTVGAGEIGLLKVRSLRLCSYVLFRVLYDAGPIDANTAAFGPRLKLAKDHRAL